MNIHKKIDEVHYRSMKPLIMLEVYAPFAKW